MSDYDGNIEYQNAPSLAGGSYTASKLARLHLPNLNGKRFLDLGCNTGFYCRLAHDQGARYVVGVDNSPKVISKARSESPADIVYRDTGWDDFPHGRYDIVILLSAIHYAKNSRSVVRNIRRSLAEDGLLILEGGVLFMQESRLTDIPLPGWRKVGGRCLHLTNGFIKNHLLADFEWEVKGASPMRGGDDVPRYVVHARPKGVEREENVYVFDPLDFFAAASQSANTIAPQQPAFAYVSQLAGNSRPDAALISRLLSDQSVVDIFADDLLFCLKSIDASVIKLRETLPLQYMSLLESVISSRAKVERFE